MERENDRIEIPEKYLNMSQEELEKESAQLLAEMKKHPQKREPVVRISDTPPYVRFNAS